MMHNETPETFSILEFVWRKSYNWSKIWPIIAFVVVLP